MNQKRHRPLLLWSLLLIAGLLVWNFFLKDSDDKKAPIGNAMYYWRTTLSLDSAETAFLSNHDVKRLYIRFFDVVNTDKGAEPNATVTIPEDTRLPEGVGYVPVVFITPEALKTMSAESMVQNVLERVVQMADTHSLPHPDEIQIDCDWTPSTRPLFDSFMTLLHKNANAKGMKVSATIRLHQLATDPPEADYGVLMVYNTGDLQHPEKGNPILSMEGVAPYLRYLKGYRLPLILALPNFSWNVLYAPLKGGGSEYRAILYGCDPAKEHDVFRQSAPEVWTAVSSRLFTSAIGNDVGKTYITPGMMVRHFSSPPFDDLMKIKSAIAEKSPEITKSVMIYDLNTPNLKTYTPKQYEKIFSR